MTLTLDLVQQAKADTLIFLPLSFVHRFAGREGQDAALDRLFGTPAWRDIPDGSERPKLLLDLFQRQLRGGGMTYTLPFRLRPAEGNSEFWIIGASRHEMGFASIKEAYWTVDPIDGQGFKPPRPAVPGQEALFEPPPADGPNTEPLLALLRERFGTSWFTVEEAAAITAASRFRDTQLKQATLVPAERDGVLEVERPPGGRFAEGRQIRMRFI